MPSPLLPGPSWSDETYDIPYLGQRLRMIRCVNCTAVGGPCNGTEVDAAFPYHTERFTCLDLLLRAEHLLSAHGAVRRTTQGLLSEDEDGTATRWVRVASDRDNVPVFTLTLGRPGGAMSLTADPYSWAVTPHRCAGDIPMEMEYAEGGGTLIAFSSDGPGLLVHQWLTAPTMPEAAQALQSVTDVYAQPYVDRSLLFAVGPDPAAGLASMAPVCPPPGDLFTFAGYTEPYPGAWPAAGIRPASRGDLSLLWPYLGGEGAEKGGGTR